MSFYFDNAGGLALSPFTLTWVVDVLRPLVGTYVAFNALQSLLSTYS